MFSTKVGDDEDSVAQLADVTLTGVKASSTGVSQSKSMVAAVSLGFTTCKSCFAAIKRLKSNNSKILYLQSIMPAIETFLENALVVFVLADCGYQITSSSIYLLANTKCLASDLTALADSYKALERMKDKVLSNQLDCNEENAKSCSYEIARRYGISLARLISDQSWPTYWSKGSRAYQCYRYCYTYAGSKEQCYSVSLGDDLKNSEVCKKKCEEQVGDCLSFCASYCCNQDGNCTKEVHKYRN